MEKSKQLEEVIENALSELSWEKECVLRLRFFTLEGKTIEDISFILGITWMKANQLIDEGLSELEQSLKTVINVYDFKNGKPLYYFLENRSVNART